MLFVDEVGDEFLVALVGTSKKGSEAYTERVRKDFLAKQQRLKYPQHIEFLLVYRKLSRARIRLLPT